MPPLPLSCQEPPLQMLLLLPLLVRRLVATCLSQLLWLQLAGQLLQDPQHQRGRCLQGGRRSRLYGPGRQQLQNHPWLQQQQHPWMGLNQLLPTQSHAPLLLVLMLQLQQLVLQQMPAWACLQLCPPQLQPQGPLHLRRQQQMPAMQDQQQQQQQELLMCRQPLLLLATSLRPL